MSSLRAVLRSTRVLRCSVAAVSAAFLATAPAAHADANQAPSPLSNPFLIANANQHMVLCADLNSTMATVEPLTLTIDPLCVWQQSGSGSDLVLYNAKKDMVLGINNPTAPFNGDPVDLMPYDSTNKYEQWAWGSPGGSGLLGVPLLFYPNSGYNLNAHNGQGKYLTITDEDQPTRQDQSWNTVSIAS
ncbi:hypothetical protein ACFXDH_02995 [Streptomyces sp. NPDC059467]|uniref:hypothetical protein n=1 Tax=Streptomyces sp. NPDC059467 TaxID=3346844 RepID=UPI003683B2A6